MTNVKEGVDINNNLKEFRLQRSWTQDEVAAKLSISTRQYQNIEAGTSNGSMKIWMELSRIYNVELDILLNYTTKSYELK